MNHQTLDKQSIIQQLMDWSNTPHVGESFLLKKLHGVARVILITLIEFNKNSLSIRASALTYTIILSLVPMLAMSTAVIKGLGGGNELKQVVYSYIDTLEETTPLTTNIPGIHVAEELSGEKAEVLSSDVNNKVTDQFRAAADQIFSYVDKTDFATLGTIGVLGVLFSAILVLNNIELSMNTIWHVSSGRSILRKVTDYLTFLILMPLSLNFGFAANAVLKNDTLLQKLTVFLPTGMIETGLLLLVPLFFITVTLFLIYIFFPNTKVKPGAALIGALFAGTLWFITQNLYIGLQIGVSKYNAIYGSFATLPLFLVWMFLGWVFILGGAQLAFAFQQQHDYQLKKLYHSPLEQLSAAFDIINITYSSYDDKTTLKEKELPALCPAYSAPLVFDSLKNLITSQIVATTENGMILPTGPQNKLHYQDVVASILGNSFPNTEGGKTASSLFQQIKPVLSNSYAQTQKS